MFFCFIINLLNSNIGSESKTNEYLTLAKTEGINIYKPDINLSGKEYRVYNKGIMLPLNVIKNIMVINILLPVFIKTPFLFVIFILL